MFKILLQYVLWQNSEKPTKWYHYLLLVLNWLIVIFFEFVLIFGLSQIKSIPTFLKIIWIFFGSINLLFSGISLEKNVYSFLIATFLGLPNAILKAKEKLKEDGI